MSQTERHLTLVQGA